MFEGENGLWEFLHYAIDFQGTGKCMIWSPIAFNLLNLSGYHPSYQSCTSVIDETNMPILHDFLSIRTNDSRLNVPKGAIEDRFKISIPSLPKTLCGQIFTESEQRTILDGTCEQFYLGKIDSYAIEGGFYASEKLALDYLARIYKNAKISEPLPFLPNIEAQIIKRLNDLS